MQPSGRMKSRHTILKGDSKPCLFFFLRNLFYLTLVCARLRHVAGTQWGNRKYMNMKHLEAAVEDTSIAG